MHSEKYGEEHQTYINGFFEKVLIQIKCVISGKKVTCHHNAGPKPSVFCKNLQDERSQGIETYYEKKHENSTNLIIHTIT